MIIEIPKVIIFYNYTGILSFLPTRSKKVDVKKVKKTPTVLKFLTDIFKSTLPVKISAVKFVFDSFSLYRNDPEICLEIKPPDAYEVTYTIDIQKSPTMEEYQEIRKNPKNIGLSIDILK